MLSPIGVGFQSAIFDGGKLKGTIIPETPLKGKTKYVIIYLNWRLADVNF